MVEIRHILLPTDFSDASRQALQHAIAIAGWYGSRISALHVGNPMVLFSTFVPLPGSSGGILTGKTNQRHLEEQVRTWLAPAANAGIETDALIDEGNPGGRILEHARSLPADLIVIGTHGQSGFERLVLGSVAEKVLRKSPCPVLTVPPPAVATSTLPLTKLLCPVDFSASSIAALRFAFSLAQESNARLTLLHVFEWPADESAARRVLETSEFRRQWERETCDQLEALIPDDVRDWCTPEPTLVSGKAYQQILSLAASERTDLIVMGVQGRNPIDLLLFGSTTQQVVRQAACPVLTLRS
jgi:nucleotide-binding universal stress UspA family protein